LFLLPTAFFSPKLSLLLSHELQIKERVIRRMKLWS
jgi:hypothetical protein